MNVKNIMKKTGKVTANMTGNALEKVVKESAPLVAVCSTASASNYAMKTLEGMKSVYDMAYSVVGALIQDTGVRSLGLDAFAEISNGFNQAIQNINENPMKVGIGALVAYGTCKALPMVSKYARQKIYHTK
jgi:hypothetical protein